MMFSELYSVYYNTVAQILKAAADHPLQRDELRAIVERNAFGESILTIVPALTEERWQLLKPDGSTPLRHAPSTPVTLLEKRWLKAVYQDPRIRLFTEDAPDLPDVEPLFRRDDILVFDKYSDGDPYTDETYVAHFRTALEAIRNRTPLSIEALNHKGRRRHVDLMPESLEYSEKDDKFRLIGPGRRYVETVNLARILAIGPCAGAFEFSARERKRQRTVEFELVDSRNALERAMLHFAHFEKQAERLDGDRYKVNVRYEEDDETEMVIRLLSFGPMVKVTSPQHFVDLMRERLLKQISCGL